MSDTEKKASKKKAIEYPKDFDAFEAHVEQIVETIDDMKQRFFPNGSSSKKKHYPVGAPGPREFNQLRSLIKSVVRDYRVLAKVPKQKDPSVRTGFNRLVYYSEDMAKTFGLEAKGLKDDEGNFIYTPALATTWWAIYVTIFNLKNIDQPANFKADATMNDLFSKYYSSTKTVDKVKGTEKPYKINKDHMKFTDIQKVLTFHVESDKKVEGTDDIIDKLETEKENLHRLKEALASRTAIFDKLVKAQSMLETAESKKKGKDEEEIKRYRDYVNQVNDEYSEADTLVRQIANDIDFPQPEQEE